MQQLFQKPLHKKLFFFSIPIICSLVTQQLYNMADMIIVGQLLGAQELAAVGNGGTIITLFIVISGGIELAVEIIFSRYIGQNDQQRLAGGAINILKVGAVLGLILAFSGLLILPELFVLMKVPDNLITLTRSYCFIYLIGVPFIYLYDISRAMITALGDSKKSFYLVLSSSLINVVLNLLLIGVFHLRIAGAALGTVIAQGSMMLLSLFLLYQKVKDNPYFTFNARIDFKQVKELAHIALPSIFQQFVITSASLFLQAFVNPFGSEIIIGYLAIIKIMTVGRIVVSGFAQTLSIFAAQMFAGKKTAELAETYRFLTRISLLYTAVMAAVFFIFPRQLCDFFFDTAVHDPAYRFFRTYLFTSSLTSFITVFKFMNESLLRSALKMKQYLCCNIGDLFLRIASTYLLTSLIASDAFWLGEVIGRTLALLLSFYFVRRLAKAIRQETALELLH